MFPPKAPGPGPSMGSVRKNVRNLPPDPIDTQAAPSTVACPACGAQLELQTAEPAAPPVDAGAAPSPGGVPGL